MAEQKRATAAGDHNAVTHEAAAETGEAKTSPAAQRKAAGARVRLSVKHPHEEFDLSALGLESVTQAGTSYTADEADQVRTLAMKYGVPVYVAAETEKES